MTYPQIVQDGYLTKTFVPDSSELKKAAILVLNWNRVDFTLACLDTLRKLDYKNREVLVIDNGSADGSEKRICEAYKEMRFLQNGENLGYAEGNNRGIRIMLSEGVEYIFIINNDTKLDSDCLKELVAVAESDKKIGIVGPIACDYENPEKILHAGHQFDWEGMSTRKRSLEEAAKHDRGDYYEADCIQGDALLVKREVFDRVGIFDPRFFLYYEDTDLCYRAKAAGYLCAVAKKARYQHMTCGTLNVGNPKLTHYLTRNGLLFVSKNSPRKDRRKNIIRFLKKMAVDIRDYNFYRWRKTKDSIYLKDIFFTLRGALDFFTGKFGRI